MSSSNDAEDADVEPTCAHASAGSIPSRGTFDQRIVGYKMLIHRTRDLTLAVLENSRATGERLSTLALSRHWRSAVACAAEREVQVGRGYWRGRIARARRAQLGAQAGPTCHPDGSRTVVPHSQGCRRAP